MSERERKRPSNPLVYSHIWWQKPRLGQIDDKSQETRLGIPNKGFLCISKQVINRWFRGGNIKTETERENEHGNGPSQCWDSGTPGLLSEWHKSTCRGPSKVCLVRRLETEATARVQPRHSDKTKESLLLGWMPPHQKILHPCFPSLLIWIPLMSFVSLTPKLASQLTYE